LPPPQNQKVESGEFFQKKDATTLHTVLADDGYRDAVVRGYIPEAVLTRGVLACEARAAEGVDVEGAVEARDGVGSRAVEVGLYACICLD